MANTDSVVLDFGRSSRLLAYGILKRWYDWVPGLLFGPEDFWERTLRRFGWYVNLELPTPLFYVLFFGGLFLAAAMTYHELRLRARTIETELVKLKNDRPQAQLDFSCDETGWARLRITNRGAGAVFSATIQTYGLTAGAVEGKRVYAQWDEVSTPTQRIAPGDARVLRLATNVQRTLYSRAWNIHRSDGHDIESTEANEVIDVTVVADPDLIEPCELRFNLHILGASEMVRRSVSHMEAHGLSPAV